MVVSMAWWFFSFDRSIDIPLPIPIPVRSYTDDDLPIADPLQLHFTLSVLSVFTRHWQLATRDLLASRFSRDHRTTAIHRTWLLALDLYTRIYRTTA